MRNAPEVVREVGVTPSGWPRNSSSSTSTTAFKICGRTVTVKVKYADFQQITRSRTGQALFSTPAEIEQLSYALLKPLFPVTTEGSLGAGYPAEIVNDLRRRQLAFVVSRDASHFGLPAKTG